MAIMNRGPLCVENIDKVLDECFAEPMAQPKREVETKQHQRMRRWTENEDRLLLAGKPVPDRTKAAQSARMAKLRHKHGEIAGITEAAIKDIRRGLNPKGYCPGQIANAWRKLAKKDGINALDITAREKRQLFVGILPEGMTHKQAMRLQDRLKVLLDICHYLPRPIDWTQGELLMLKKGKRPSGRHPLQCANIRKGWKIGIYTPGLAPQKRGSRA